MSDHLILALEFIVSCMVTAAIAVVAVHVIRYAIKVYEEVRWWK